MKELDLNRSLADLVSEYPEVLMIMHDLGFKEIKRPGMIQTVGKYMTINKGMKLKKVPLEVITTKFEAHGFTVIGG
ncbi:DUF1858 domain-containing protein [Enterococcus sp. LJL99]